MFLRGGESHDAPMTLERAAPPPNKPKTCRGQRLGEYSSLCATEQCSDSELGGFPSIPPPEKPNRLRSRCLATASHSVKGRGYSHVRTWLCRRGQRCTLTKVLVSDLEQFSKQLDVCADPLSMRARGIVEYWSSYGRTWCNQLRDRAVAPFFSPARGSAGVETRHCEVSFALADGHDLPVGLKA
jgi:hypothetical protein